MSDYCKDHGGFGPESGCRICRPAAPAPTPQPECRDCEAPLNEGEASTFTVCSPCWDKRYPKPVPTVPFQQESTEKMDANSAAPTEPVCSHCNDTHIMTFPDSGRDVMCTHCPTPCKKCRKGGNGPYCETTPCACACHKKAAPTEPEHDPMHPRQGSIKLGPYMTMEAAAAAPKPVTDAWPKDPANGRLLCSPAHPMPKGAKGQWAHTNTEIVGGNSEGCCDYLRCKDCGEEWRVCYDY